MTNAEYDASVQALLGTTMTPSTNLPARFAPACGGYHAERRAAGRPRPGEGARRRRAGAGGGGADGEQVRDARPVHEHDVGRARPARRTFITSFGAKAFRRAGRRPSETTDLGRALPRGRRQPRDLQRGHRPGDARDAAVGGLPVRHGAGRRGASGAFTLTQGRAGEQSVVPGRRRTARRDAARHGDRGRSGDARRARDAGAPPAGDAAGGAIAWCASCASGWASIASRTRRRTPPSTRTSRRPCARRWTPRAKKFIDEVVQRLDRDGRRAAERELEHRRQRRWRRSTA